MRTLPFVLTAVACLGTSIVLAQGASPAGRLRALADEYWEWQLREFPETATWLGDARFADRLTDWSPGAIARRRADLRAMLARVRAIEAEALSGQDRLTREALAWELELAVEGHAFPRETLILDQLDGPHLAFPQLVSISTFATPADYEHYLARLSAYAVQLGQIEALLRSGMARGWVQASVPLRSVPNQIDGQITDDPAASPLYAPFLEVPDGWPARDRIRHAGREALESTVFPALRRFRDFVRNEYLPAGRKAPGIDAVPDGAKYYAYLVRLHTTTGLTADRIHRIGLDEVARIRAEMEAVVAETGFTGGFDAFLEFLRTDRRFYFDTPEALVTAYRDAAKRVDGELPRFFAELPRNPYGVRAFPDFEAPAQTTARYYPGAADGSRAGFFMVNTYRLDMRPKYEIEVLTLHEAVPGHHLQIARAQELTGLPAFRRNALGLTAFVEGWALYAERLGREMGFYADPYSRFGQLTYEMWRACRLVVDTGLHHLGWTREQAIDLMRRNTAKSLHDIEVEVDRYIAQPGQALAYKIGELRIRELRARAERALGDRFDLRAFHNALLDNGALPLDLLEREIDRWIASRSSPSESSRSADPPTRR